MARGAKSGKRLTTRKALGAVTLITLALFSSQLQDSVPRKPAGRSLAGLRTHSEPSDCPTLSEVVGRQRDRLIAEMLENERFTHSLDEESSPSYVIEETQSTPHGPVAYLRLKRDRAWFSYYGKTNRNPQGDPRHLARLYSPRAARAFGLDFGPTWNLVRLPFAERMNWTLNALAENGVPTGARFFDAPGKVSERLAIVEFSHHRAFGMGRAVELLGHDHGFHSGVISLPIEVILHAQNQARMVELFLESLDGLRGLSRSQQRALARVIQRIEFEYSNLLDVGSGNFVDNLYRIESGAPAVIERLYDNGFNYFTQSGLSPASLTLRLMHSALVHIGESPRSEFARHLMDAYYLARAHYPTPAAVERRLTMSRSHFIQATRARHRAIRAAAERIAPPHDTDDF